MADGKVEKIIEFQAGKAISQLDQVISRLNKTNQVLANLEKQANAISFEKFIPSINNFVDSFAKLKIQPQNLGNIQIMAQALNRFKMTAIELNKANFAVDFSKITRGLSDFTYEIANSFQKFKMLQDVAKVVSAFALAMNRLTNVSEKTQNMKVTFTSLTQAIYAFVGSILRIKDLETVIVLLERLGNAMEKIQVNFERFSLLKALDNLDKMETTIESLRAKFKALGDETKKLTFWEKLNTQIVPAFNKWLGGATNLNKEIRTLRRLLSLSWLRSVFNMFKRMGETIYDLVKAYSSYIENINLATVAYYGLEEAAESLYPFVEKISKAFGLNESEVTRSVGLFKQMANAMGLAQEQSDLLATSLTKMAYDISSLYNISFDRALSALQSSLVGQTKPIRGATGADITENTLRITLKQLNIGKEIRELSYVEKRLVMVISLTKQLANAQGDLARTIESPANQLKVLSQQLERLKIALGNLLTIFVGQLLPYINGFIMALVEVINYVAAFLRELLGVEEEEFDYSGLTGTSDAVGDIIDGMQEANEEAEKLKKNLLGIDELNILEPQETASTDSLIDPTIMAAFEAALKDWENRMDSVNMKAYQVRDALLSWFGLEYDEEGNPVAVLGGKVDDLTQKIKNAKEWLDNLMGTGGEGGDDLPLLTLAEKLKAAFLDIWKYIDAISITFIQMKFPLLTGIFKMFEGIIEIIDRGADFENIMDIVEGIGWGLIAIGATLKLPVFTGLGLFIVGISKTIDAINKALADGKIQLHELDDILVAIGVTIAGLALMGKLKTVVGWLIALKGWVVNVGRAVVAAIGGNSAAQSALVLLTKNLRIAFGWISILVGAFEIFENIKGWIDGTIPPLQALFGILKGIALVVMGIAAVLHKWHAVAIAGGFLAAAGIAEAITESSYKKKNDTEKKDKSELEVEIKNEIYAMDEAIASTVSSLDFKYMANGGYPDKGLFLMNDGNSAEMFGSINGKAAVVNNQEIASALAQAMTPLLGSVVTAVENVAASDRPIILNVDSRQMARANQKGSQKLGYNQIGGEFANV